MIIAVIGPKDLARYCKEVIRNENPEVKVMDKAYSVYTETPEIVAELQKEVDGILFCGKTPFKITEKKVPQKVPWAFLDRETGTLFRAILEADIMLEKDIRRMSVDTYDREMIIMAYSDIGIKEEELDIYTAEQRMLDERYHDYLRKFHIDNYRYNKVSCCITGFTEIYQFLRSINIPCVRTTAPQSTILLAYHQIEKKYIESYNRNKETVVIDIKVDFPKAYEGDGYRQYFQVCNKNKAAETIYLFAAKIDAAIVEAFNDRFLIFTTNESLKKETGESFDKLYLFDQVRDVNIKNIHIGIGYGDTMAEAQDNAETGRVEAEKVGENTAFIVSGKGKMSARIKLTRAEKGGTESMQEDFMYKLSKDTGISTASLWKIYRGVKYFNGRDITSKGLATVCEMSKRNMDRLILKLEKAGACEVVGERVEGKTGRPTRIIRFLNF